MPTPQTAVVKCVTVRVAAPNATPSKTAKVAGISLTLNLRTAVILLRRYDAPTATFIPLENFPIVVRLIDSNQQTTILTNADGRADAEYPDTNVEFRLSATSVPAGYDAQLNYTVRSGKREDLTVVFIPTALRRNYSNWQSI